MYVNDVDNDLHAPLSLSLGSKYLKKKRIYGNII